MSELSKFQSYKKKLEGICDENNLVFRFRHDTYPISLTIKPCAGCEAQMSMLETVEDDGYRSPDAMIVFAIRDGDLSYTMSDTFSIGDALFAKIRNLFQKMHTLWVQYVFRTFAENEVLASKIPDDPDEEIVDSADIPAEAETLEGFEEESDDE